MAHMHVISLLMQDRVYEAEQLLQSRMINVNIRDTSGRTALDYVLIPRFLKPSYCFYNEEDITDMRSYLYKAKLLLEHGADPNSCDRQGWTIMHQCAWNGNLTLLQLCVQHGGKINTANKAGQTPVDLAFCKNHTPLVRYLESQSCNLSQLCRMTIREAIGKNFSWEIHKLPIPKSLKLYLNYGVPYPGWEASAFVPQPWTKYEMQHEKVNKEEVQQFLKDHASENFLKEHEIQEETTMNDFIRMMEELYFKEAFKRIKFVEELPVRPKFMRKRKGNW